jgi:hypothetical protein
MSEIDIELPKPHPAQQPIIDHPARFKVLACGRRFGKTMIAVRMICSCLLKGHSAAYFAPTYRMTKEVWEELKALLAPLTSHISEHDYRLQLHSGGILECWSLQGTSAETVRGRKYHLAVIDEAAIVSDARIWQAAIRPLLTDYQGSALFCSTPRGRNWFWNLFVQGQDISFANWMSWQLPTKANPYLKDEEIADAKHGLPERVFKQEYLAQFLEDGGAVFRNLDRVCVAKQELEPESGNNYVFGVDWGKSNDFTCISVFDCTRNQQVYLDRFNQISWEIQRNRLISLYERFKPTLIWAEANSVGEPNIEALQAEGLPVRSFYTTGKTKAPLIEELVLAIEQEKIALLSDAILINEMQIYEMSRLANGGWRYSAPPGGHDDTVIATALSWHGAYKSGPLRIDFIENGDAVAREEIEERRRKAGLNVQILDDFHWPSRTRPSTKRME